MFVNREFVWSKDSEIDFLDHSPNGHRETGRVSNACVQAFGQLLGYGGDGFAANSDTIAVSVLPGTSLALAKVGMMGAHSYLNAIVGLILTARTAGRRQASRETATSTTAIDINVKGSLELMP